MSCLMTSFLPSTIRSLDYLLPEPGIMPQSLTSELSDVHTVHFDRTETADTLLSMVKLRPVKVVLKLTFSDLFILLKM